MNIREYQACLQALLRPMTDRQTLSVSIALK